MLRNARFWGVILWVFSLQVFVATYGGRLGENIWLDVATGVVMFMVASFFLGYSLSGSGQVFFVSVFLLIAVDSALITFRVYDQTPYRWYDLMTIVAGPQMFIMSIGCLLASRRRLAQQNAA